MKKYLLVLSLIFTLIVSFSVGVMAMSSSPVEPEADQDGLIAHYPLNGNLNEIMNNFSAGEVIGDSIDNESGGEVIFREGRDGQAAYFDGNSGVRLADGLIRDDNYSVSFWLKPEQLTTFTTTFFAAADQESWISLVPEGPMGETMLWSGEDWFDAVSYYMIPTEEWSHIAFAVDGEEIKLYLNGEERFSDTGFPNVFNNAKGTFVLGVNWWDQAYKGMIDDLRIYNKAVDFEKISELAEGAPKIKVGDGPQFRNASVHDPMVIKDDGTFYVFGSHLASAKSDDLIQWEQIDSGVHSENAVIPNAPDELEDALEWAESDTTWAKSVVQLEDGKYYMYYSACRGDSPRSALGVAISDNVDGPYENMEILLKSGMWGEESEDGTIYDLDVHPNAIDPHVFFDKEGELWMVYGSYSGGIFMLEMDQEIGKPYPGQGYGDRIMGGRSRIEAPYIFYSPETDYYYLFSSFGGLGAGHGYQIRVARSKEPSGPYYDPQGNDMIESYGEGIDTDDAIEPYGAKLLGDFRFLDEAGEATGVGYVSPGHNSAYYEEETGQHFILFHSRFPERGEAHQVRVHKLLMNENDWPVIAPHRYGGEEIRDYSKEEVIGSYAFVNHGRDISGEIRDSVKIKLEKDGKITGEVEGSWERSKENNVVIEVNDVIYNGVLLEQWDSGLEKEVMTFSALSETGLAIMGSQLN